MNSSLPLAALRACSLALLCTALSSVSPAQTATPSTRHRVITLDYHKPEPGKTQDYIRLEREVWKPVHQDRVTKGKIISWKLYSVSWPNGADQEYDFVTMTEFANFAELESPYEGTDPAKVIGQEKFAEMQKSTGAVRKMRRSDLLNVLLSTDAWTRASNQILVVHYLRALPGKGGDLMKSQREYYLPFNEEAVKNGNAASWATAGVRYPYDLNHPYNFVSFNGYESLTQMDKPLPQPMRDKWIGTRSAENQALLEASRKRVNGQLWRLVDQTTPRQLTTSR